MGIRISRIEVEHLGPLSSFKKDLKDVTLIYGLNEKGKTFLVEFILKSLFKNLAGFKNEFRIGKPGGKVVVTGLGNESVIFSPGSKNKLETRWAENGQGMPANISRLLVVKGGDTNIERNTDGISQDSIREFLSNQGILDSIQINIRLKSTKESRIEDGEIFGLNSGDLAKRNDSRSDIKNIDQLMEKININLAEGDAIALDTKIALAEESIRNMEAAKKYTANTVAQEKAKVDAELNRYEDAKFKQIEKNFEEYSQKQEEITLKQREKNETAQRGEHYLWLDKAVEEYQKWLGQTIVNRHPGYFVVALFFLAAAAFLMIFKQIWPALLCILLAGGLLFWYFQKVNKMLSNQAVDQELEKIRATYLEKFNEPCKDISTMRVKREAIASDYHAVQQIEKDIEKTEAEIQSLTNKIQQGFKELGYSKLTPEQWGSTISSCSNRINDLGSQSREFDKALARYDVDPSDYIKSDPGIPYKRADYDRAETDKDNLINERNTLEQSLHELKSEIQARVGDYSLIEWSDLIHKLREIRSRKVEDYKQYTADIIAGNLLNQAIEKIREQEDQDISESLDLEIVQEPLKRISQHYVKVELDEGSVNIIDEYNQAFNINDLSTGTREQIFLALRMGFARKILQGNTAFMILDDAFQHSDWERRPSLVDSAFKLAKQGWQVIYFSMDDNIRDLFDTRGKKAPKGSYVRIDI